MSSTLAPETLAAAATENIRQAVTNLALAGAEYIMVPNLSDLALTPESIAGGPETMQRATSLSAAFNTALSGVLAGLEAAFPIDLIPLDVRSLFNSVVEQPGPVWPDQRQYALLQRSGRPSRHRLREPGRIPVLGQRASDHRRSPDPRRLRAGGPGGLGRADVAPAPTMAPVQVAEPATLVMLAGGLLGLGLMRRRQA